MAALRTPRATLVVRSDCAARRCSSVLFAVTLDRLEHRVRDGGRFALDEFASIQIAEGWGIESQSELFTTIAKGGMTSVLVPSIESVSTASDYAQVLVDGLEGAGTWQVDPIREFMTDAGVPGSSYLAYGTDDVAGAWVVADKGRLVVFSGTASESAFKDGLDDMDQMARSILIESISGAGE